MNMSRKIAVIGSLFALSLACAGGEETPPPDPQPVAEPEPAPVPETAPGKIPGLEFPVLKTTAAAGDFVLAPSRDFFDKAATDGIENATFIFYGATMVEPGEGESKVKSLAGTEFTIPNSLIVHIDPKQTAEVGDIVLGHWESGSGLQRAIVVAGGTPEEPKVKYLDLDPEGIGKDPDMWKADRFVVVEPGRVGVTVGCKKDSSVEHGILVSLTPKKVLVLGFAGRMSAHPVEECQPVDPTVKFAVGDKVQAPFVSSFGAGEVTKVDAANGRVMVKLDTGEKSVAVVDVAKAFDTFGEGFVAERGIREGKGGKGKADGEGKAGKGEGKAKGKKGG